MEMNIIHYDRRDLRPLGETDDHGALTKEMEASAHALFLADNAHVHGAINSVRWERRGLLQRLTRREGSG
jgi:hypothetical protein